MSTDGQPVILVIDDTPDNLKLMAGLLKDDYRVKIANSGEKGLAIATGSPPPDLILLDVMMPGMDGYEVCRRLKANPETEEIPVIFLTAMTSPEDETRGFAAGAVDYIHKPLSPPIVLARIKTHLKLRATLQEALRARREADVLLHVLLPKAAADEIREIGTVIPRRHEKVAVLFCDVVNFTAYCEKHSPEDVVSRLDTLFVKFEQVTRDCGLEKIKTIGDAFMAASGLLEEVADPLDAAIRCGLRLSSSSIDADVGWTVRVGVHLGPMVSGIVGQERYQFDIWGDTVNVAARMAGKGRPGSVALSGEMWALVADRFHGEALGDLELKGKGMVSVYQITGEKV
ncbi:MAG TPA: response regulator [Rhodospirillaceae bacterium]|nr:response regulator [Rhodospirillaceae bacterium]